MPAQQQALPLAAIKMENLQTAIDKLRRSTYVSFNRQFDNFIANIDKYFDTDEEKAYVLGYLFANKNFIKNLPKDTEDIITNAIRSGHLQDYFYHELKPKPDELKPFSLFFLITGLLVTIGGIILFINGYVWVGLGTRFLIPVVHDGGTITIMGLVFLIGGFMRYKYEKRKQKFISNIQKTINSS